MADEGLTGQVGWSHWSSPEKSSANDLKAGFAFENP